SRLFDWVQVFPLKVLDDGDLEGLLVGKITHYRGNRRQARTLCCAKPTLACHDLVTAVDRPDHDRLEDTAFGNRGGQLGYGGLVEVPAWLQWRGAKQGDGDVLNPLLHLGKQGVQAPPEASRLR